MAPWQPFTNPIDGAAIFGDESVHVECHENAQKIKGENLE